MEPKKISDNQWMQVLNELKGLIENNAFLEEKEFQNFENNCDFIMRNVPQFKRLPVKDYYYSLELLTDYRKVTANQSRYKEALKIADFLQEIADEIRGKRKSKEDIQKEKEKIFENELQMLNHKYFDLMAQFDNLRNIDANADKLKIAEYKKKAQKDQKIIEDMVGTVADNANAGRYIKYANYAKYTANGLFLISITIMIGVAMIALWPLLEGYHIDWIDLLPRVPVFFVVLLPSFFMMREAKKQRDKEFQFKDMECRILTSGQFIDSLELKKSEKDALKAQLVKDLFGKPMEYHSDGGLPPIDNICEIVKTCLESCKKN